MSEPANWTVAKGIFDLTAVVDTWTRGFANLLPSPFYPVPTFSTVLNNCRLEFSSPPPVLEGDIWGVLRSQQLRSVESHVSGGDVDAQFWVMLRLILVARTQRWLVASAPFPTAPAFLRLERYAHSFTSFLFGTHRVRFRS